MTTVGVWRARLEGEGQEGQLSFALVTLGAYGSIAAVAGWDSSFTSSHCPVAKIIAMIKESSAQFLCQVGRGQAKGTLWNSRLVSDTHVPNPTVPSSNSTRPKFLALKDEKLRHLQTIVDFLMGRRDSIKRQEDLPSFLPGPS